MNRWTRRHFMQQSLSTIAIGAGLSHSESQARASQPFVSADGTVAKKAKICITLDLEMSRNFPTWESTHWDYEKGNLDEAAKAYSIGAARRVAQAGGSIHFFVVGRVLEQANVDWLLELIDMGHSLGNHTYDHVNVTASKPSDIQFRFQRAPWLLEGQSVAEAIRQNIRLCSLAMKDRLKIEPNGFRTPGGFANGLREHAGVRAELLNQGFTWVSSLYPPHPNSMPGEAPSKEVIDGIVAAQPLAQPFRYPDGLIELPMSPISDIGAFRTGRWKLPSFLTAIKEAIAWTIANQAVFDFLAHPSCLGVVDPDFKTIDMICRQVQEAGDRATLSNLNETLA